MWPRGARCRGSSEPTCAPPAAAAAAAAAGYLPVARVIPRYAGFEAGRNAGCLCPGTTRCLARNVSHRWLTNLAFSTASARCARTHARARARTPRAHSRAPRMRMHLAHGGSSGRMSWCWAAALRPPSRSFRRSGFLWTSRWRSVGRCAGRVHRAYAQPGDFRSISTSASSRAPGARAIVMCAVQELRCRGQAGVHSSCRRTAHTATRRHTSIGLETDHRRREPFARGRGC